MPDTHENGTRIIKTFKGEAIFLISLSVFLAGILGAYYSLVKDIAVMKNDYSNQTALISKFLDKYDDHLADNQKDHDDIVTIKSKLKIK